MRLYGLGLAFALGRYGRRAQRFDPAAGSGSFVYVIKGAHGAVKIGSSVDPERRCAELQTGSPHRLWVEYSVRVDGPAEAVEYAAHDILSAHRGMGEWFSVPTEAAVAAIHAAAFRVGVPLGGVFDGLPSPNWNRRILGAAALATPFWACLALGQPVVAVAWMAVALAGFVVSVLRNGPDAERPLPNVMRWVGAAIGGAALPMLPAALISAALT